MGFRPKKILPRGSCVLWPPLLRMGPHFPRSEGAVPPSECDPAGEEGKFKIAAGLARLLESPTGKRYRRNRRNLVSGILQGTTGRAPETGPKTGRSGSKTRALPGTVPVLVIRDRSGVTADAILPKDDHREIKALPKPLLARDAVLCSDGGGKGPIALAAREMGVAIGR